MGDVVRPGNWTTPGSGGNSPDLLPRPLGVLQIDLGLVGLRAQCCAHRFIQLTRHLLLCQMLAPGPLPPLGSESPTWGGEPPCQAAGKRDAGQGPGSRWQLWGE